MKIFTFSTASGAFLAAFAYAAPPSALETRQFQVSVTFFGADGAQYTQSFPADNSLVKISTFFFFFLKSESKHKLSIKPGDTLDELAITFKKAKLKYNRREWTFLC